jgi:hypothetical protein
VSFLVVRTCSRSLLIQVCSYALYLSLSLPLIFLLLLLCLLTFRSLKTFLPSSPSLQGGWSWRWNRQFVGAISYGIRSKLWRPQSHKYFPPYFRRGAYQYIIDNATCWNFDASLPADMVFLILNFCGWDWFPKSWKDPESGKWVFKKPEKPTIARLVSTGISSAMSSVSNSINNARSVARSNHADADVNNDDHSGGAAEEIVSSSRSTGGTRSVTRSNNCRIS